VILSYFLRRCGFPKGVISKRIPQDFAVAKYMRFRPQT
jgi:hypothetical protein